jgi:hypothetical protein
MRKAVLGSLFSVVCLLAVAACAPPKGADGKPAVIITSPAPGAKVKSPLRVTGTADVFEATFRIQLVDASTGTTVFSEQMVMASCGTGCRGTFDIVMGFPPITGALKLKAFEYSSKDGHRIDLAEVAVVGAP